SLLLALSFALPSLARPHRVLRHERKRSAGDPLGDAPGGGGFAGPEARRRGGDGVEPRPVGGSLGGRARGQAAPSRGPGRADRRAAGRDRRRGLPARPGGLASPGGLDRPGRAAAREETGAGGRGTRGIRSHRGRTPAPPDPRRAGRRPGEKTRAGRLAARAGDLPARTAPRRPKRAPAARDQGKKSEGVAVRPIAPECVRSPARASEFVSLRPISGIHVRSLRRRSDPWRFRLRKSPRVRSLESTSDLCVPGPTPGNSVRSPDRRPSGRTAAGWSATLDLRRRLAGRRDLGSRAEAGEDFPGAAPLPFPDRHVGAAAGDRLAVWAVDPALVLAVAVAGLAVGGDLGPRE